jgi:hypothetical protein
VHQSISKIIVVDMVFAYRKEIQKANIRALALKYGDWLKKIIKMTIIFFIETKNMTYKGTIFQHKTNDMYNLKKYICKNVTYMNIYS